MQTMAYNICQIENYETNINALSLNLNYLRHTKTRFFINIKVLIMLCQGQSHRLVARTKT